MYPLDRLWDIWELQMFLGIDGTVCSDYSFEFPRPREQTQGREQYQEREDDIVYHLVLNLETSEFTLKYA